jgi:hypothetical protein
MPRVTIGVQLIPQHGDFETMKRAWLEADSMGVDRIYNWDHFFPLSGDREGKHFESLTVQAAMAALTENAEISSLVICNSYRNPHLLADMWHGFGDPATMKRKTAILDDWCAKVGRDPAEIRRSTTIARLTGDHQDPEAFVELGFSDFVVSVQGPDWDLAPLDRALAWRDSLG